MRGRYPIPPSVVFLAARNALTDLCRERDKPDRDTHQVLPYSAAGEVESPTPEIQNAIDESIRILKPLDQQIICLRYRRTGFTFEQIAKELNVREGTVRQRHSRQIKNRRADLPP